MALADAKEAINPEGPIGRIGCFLEERNPKPAAMAQVGGREWFVALERAPDPHRHSGQVQFPGHHQGITAVVTWPNQHKHPGLEGFVLQQMAGHEQGRLFHQGLDWKPTGEQLLLELGHLPAADEQVIGITGHGHGYGYWHGHAITDSTVS